jgi:hypothetical protein
MKWSKHFFKAKTVEMDIREDRQFVSLTTVCWTNSRLLMGRSVQQ